MSSPKLAWGNDGTIPDGGLPTPFYRFDFPLVNSNGSLFIGLDTLLGPVYFATGFDEGGGSAYYLFLGRTF